MSQSKAEKLAIAFKAIDQAFPDKKPKVKAKLIGSSPTLERLLAMIGERYFYSETTAELIGHDTWAVSTGKGPLAGFRIIKKGNRFRFESIEKGAQ